jgi:TRAP-type C4-dicarboxylate transport system permease small subunit
MKKINQRIGRVETLVGVVMMSVIVGLVFIAAVTRMRIINRPIVWSVDLAQLLFIWVCMFGADAALKNKAHVGVDMLVRLFPARLQRAVSLVTHLLCLAFLSFLVYWGAALCGQNYLRSYSTLGVSYSFGTLAVPVVSVLMILSVLEQLFDLLAGRDAGTAGGDFQSPLPPIS